MTWQEDLLIIVFIVAILAGAVTGVTLLVFFFSWHTDFNGVLALSEVFWTWSLVIYWTPTILYELAYPRSSLRNRVRPLILRRLPEKDFDVRQINIKALSSSQDFRLSADRNRINMPLNARCTEIIKHDNDLVAKLVAVTADQWQVALVGKDTTSQPFLYQLPPNYWNKNIDECERWIVQARENDEIEAS